jgi:transposase
VLEETVDERETLIAEQEVEISWLRQQLQLLRQQRFGPSSEKLSEEQLLLMLENEGAPTTVPEPPETIAVKGHRRAKGGRRPLPENLPRIEILHDVSPEEKICPHDGHPLKRIGEETSEQLSYKPAEMQVLLHVRPKYARLRRS